MSKKYDVVVIGGGPAGLTAGIYLSRAKLNTLLFEKIICGGQINLTDTVENYPGYPDGISGLELAQNIKKQAEKFGVKIEQQEVLKIEKINGQIKTITSQDEYLSLSLIVASGADNKKLNIQGEDKFIGRGISYCATCDAPFFKDKNVFVIGGGNTALTEAIHLTKFAKKVYIVHRRDKFRATKIIQDSVFSNPKCEFILNSVVEEFEGDEFLQEIKIKNLITNQIYKYPADGVFIAIGKIPQTNFLKGIIELDENGYVITDENMQSSQRGIFAAGDVRKKLLRQIITACSDGAIAAYSVQNYIEEISK